MSCFIWQCKGGAALGLEMICKGKELGSFAKPCNGSEQKRNEEQGKAWQRRSIVSRRMERFLGGDFMEHTLLTKKEAAEYLRISEYTLDTWMHDGAIPYVQRVKGGNVFFRKSALDRYIEDHERVGGNVSAVFTKKEKSKTPDFSQGWTYRKRRTTA